MKNVCGGQTQQRGGLDGWMDGWMGWMSTLPPDFSFRVMSRTNSLMTCVCQPTYYSCVGYNNHIRQKSQDVVLLAYLPWVKIQIDIAVVHVMQTQGDDVIVVSIVVS